MVRRDGSALSLARTSSANGWTMRGSGPRHDWSNNRSRLLTGHVTLVRHSALYPSKYRVSIIQGALIDYTSPRQNQRAGHIFASARSYQRRPRKNGRDNQRMDPRTGRYSRATSGG